MNGDSPKTPEARTLDDRGPSGPPPAEGASGLARYQTLELLGQGGMGRVYKAWDTQLSRFVALKFLRSGDPAHERRFLQEARAQARVIHEHVCRVYEVGKDERGIYIAMQHVAGPTLAAMAPELTLEQKAAIIRAAAEAVHEAHRMGLIHRDLKPQNILVERTEDGGLCPYVADFGLARELGTPGSTATGTLLGTPNYMSPEQARGESARLDRRTDVYSLGATLYELLAGKPPFHGFSDFQILYRAVHDDPVPPRQLNPDVPADLESIALKCMEKEQDRRYGSARALAEDLQRWIDGLPVQAQPSSLTQRLRKLVRRNPAAAIGAGALVLLLLGLGTLGAWSQRRAAARERAAQRFGQDVQQIDSILRYAALLPLHDSAREKAMARERMRRIQDQMKQLGSYSEGPGEYALGRGALALREVDAARAHLEAAWARGYRDPQVGYALGVALSAIYERELKQAERLGTAAEKAARKAELGRTLRDPALSALRAAGAHAMDAPQYGEALIAFLEGRLDEALEKTRSAAEALPWFYEARLLEGDVLYKRSFQRSNAGDRAPAEADLGSAETAYRAAARLAPSDPQTWASVCSATAQRFTLHVYEAGPAMEEDGAQVLAACEQALRIAPGRADLLVGAADVHRALGEHQAFTGTDPAPEVARVAALTDGALALGSHQQEALQVLGRALWAQGSYLATHGGGERDPLARGEAALQKALELDPKDADALNTLGLIHLQMGNSMERHGEDPGLALDKCARDFGRIIELFPAMGRPRQNQASCLLAASDWARDHGQDAAPLLARAIEGLQVAVKSSPTAMRLTALADAIDGRAELELQEGRDPREWCRQAGAALGTAIEKQPRLGLPHLRLARMHRTLAEYACLTGSPCEDELRAARVEDAKLAELNPGDAALYPSQVATELLAARIELSRSRPAEVLLAAARAKLANGLLANPRSAPLEELAAAVEAVAARSALRRGSSPEAAVRAGRGAAAAALALNPDSTRARVAAAELGAAEAEWLQRAGQPAARALAPGLAAAERALQINPRSAEAWAAIAALHAVAGNRDQGALSLARAAWAQALRLDPLLAGERARLAGALAAGPGVASR